MNMYLYCKWVVYYISIYYSVLESPTYSQAIQRACEYRWNLVEDKCYFFSDEFKNYARAKEFCDKLKPRGRLYVPLNESELTLVAQEAAQHIHSPYILLGINEAQKVENTKTWYWSSGQKITSPWCHNQPNAGIEDQIILIVTRNSPHCLHDDRLSATRRFICQEAQGLIIPKHKSTSVNHSELFDFNVTTCMNTTAALHPVGFYIIDLIIPHKLNNGTMTVWFNQPVDCNKRQISTWKSAVDCRNGDYLKSCDLLTTGSTPSTSSCEYRCPCAEDGCEIVLVDDTKQQEQKAGDICEITYEN